MLKSRLTDEGLNSYKLSVKEWVEKMTRRLANKYNDKNKVLGN